MGVTGCSVCDVRCVLCMWSCLCCAPPCVCGVYMVKRGLCEPGAVMACDVWGAGAVLFNVLRSLRVEFGCVLHVSVFVGVYLCLSWLFLECVVCVALRGVCNWLRRSVCCDVSARMLCVP